MDPEVVQQRVQRVKEVNQYAIPVDYGLHLQDWLIHQQTENAGCPLLDTPYLWMTDND